MDTIVFVGILKNLSRNAICGYLGFVNLKTAPTTTRMTTITVMMNMCGRQPSASSSRGSSLAGCTRRCLQ